MVVVSDSVAREKAPLIEAATATGLHLIQDAEGACREASGPIKRRYLYVFEVPEARQGGGVKPCERRGGRKKDVP
jgi:hypothetical protein